VASAPAPHRPSRPADTAPAVRRRFPPRCPSRTRPTEVTTTRRAEAKAGQQLERLPTPQMLNHCQHTDNGYATRTRTGNGYCKTRALFKINYNVYPPVFYYGRRTFHHCKTPRPTGLLGPFDG